MTYGSWDINCNRYIFFVVLGHFLPFCHFLPFFAQKMKTSRKWRKHPRDIIILHKCTINCDYMLYCSGDMVRDGCNCYFSFWVAFCFYPSNSPKISKKMKKKKKMTGDIIILHKCTKTHNHMLYCSWDLVHDGCNCYFSFWTIFCPFTSATAWKMKISKKMKKILEISSFYKSVQKTMIICYTALEIWRVTDVIVFHFRQFFALLPH